MLRVLSIDGGGIRGLIAAMVLAELEQRTGRPISESFDLIAGTSTGGILALGLTVPDVAGTGPRYSAEDLVGLYIEEGPRIFRRSLWRKVTALDNILEEKYPSGPIEDVLQRYFGDARLKDALTPVLVPCYEIERRQPFFFKSHRAVEDDDFDYAMWDVARATSAAPTYFEPHRIEVPGGASPGYWSLVDGGVFANNPAMSAYVESRDTRWFGTGAGGPGGPGEAGGAPGGAGGEDLVLLSLGTGELTRPIPHDEAVTWGVAQWVQPLLAVVFDGISDTTDYHLRSVMRDVHVGGYHRLQVRLLEGSDDLDDTSATNLRMLQLLAERLIAERAEVLDRVVADLQPPA